MVVLGERPRQDRVGVEFGPYKRIVYRRPHHSRRLVYGGVTHGTALDDEFGVRAGLPHVRRKSHSIVIYLGAYRQWPHGRVHNTHTVVGPVEQGIYATQLVGYTDWVPRVYEGYDGDINRRSVRVARLHKLMCGCAVWRGGLSILLVLWNAIDVQLVYLVVQRVDFLCYHQ